MPSLSSIVPPHGSPRQTEVTVSLSVEMAAVPGVGVGDSGMMVEELVGFHQAGEAEGSASLAMTGDANLQGESISSYVHKGSVKHQVCLCLNLRTKEFWQCRTGQISLIYG